MRPTRAAHIHSVRLLTRKKRGIGFWVVVPVAGMPLSEDQSLFQSLRSLDHSTS